MYYFFALLLIWTLSTKVSAQSITTPKPVSSKKSASPSTQKSGFSKKSAALPSRKPQTSFEALESANDEKIEKELNSYLKSLMEACFKPQPLSALAKSLDTLDDWITTTKGLASQGRLLLSLKSREILNDIQGQLTAWSYRSFLERDLKKDEKTMLIKEKFEQEYKRSNDPEGGLPPSTWSQNILQTLTCIIDETGGNEEEKRAPQSKKTQPKK